MPIYFLQEPDPQTRLGIWAIGEDASFYLRKVEPQRAVSHPHKNLQHLAGRYLLRHLFPRFPTDLIRVADTRKPFLEDEAYHFSISHCGDYAAAIVSTGSRVGVDLELVSPKVARIRHKFLAPDEEKLLRMSGEDASSELTLYWCCKEAVFKWYGLGHVDFRAHIQLQSRDAATRSVRCFFSKTGTDLVVRYEIFGDLVLAWVCTPSETSFGPDGNNADIIGRR